ncbi:MAG TPA: hypothetical protein VIN59_04865 [Alphaproteobacteria bacterium]
MKSLDSTFWFLIAAISILAAFILGIIVSDKALFALAPNMGGAFLQYQGVLGSLIAVIVALIAAKAAWANVNATHTAARIQIEENEKRAAVIVRKSLRREWGKITDLQNRLIHTVEAIVRNQEQFWPLSQSVDNFRLNDSFLNFDFLSKLNQEDHINVAFLLESLGNAERITKQIAPLSNDRISKAILAMLTKSMKEFFQILAILTETPEDKDAILKMAYEWQTLGNLVEKMKPDFQSYV